VGEVVGRSVGMALLFSDFALLFSDFALLFSDFALLLPPLLLFTDFEKYVGEAVGKKVGSTSSSVGDSVTRLGESVGKGVDFTVGNSVVVGI